MRIFLILWLVCSFIVNASQELNTNKATENREIQEVMIKWNLRTILAQYIWAQALLPYEVILPLQIRVFIEPLLLLLLITILHPVLRTFLRKSYRFMGTYVFYQAPITKFLIFFGCYALSVGYHVGWPTETLFVHPLMHHGPLYFLMLIYLQFSMPLTTACLMIISIYTLQRTIRGLSWLSTLGMDPPKSKKGLKTKRFRKNWITYNKI